MRRESAPGDVLLGFWPLAAGLLVLGNDLWLKIHHPGRLSGKLSDLGLCFLFPVFLLALAEWGRFVVGRGLCRGPGWILTVCGVGAGYFAGLQLVPEVARLHVWALSTLFPWEGFVVTPDVGDLWSLLCVPLAAGYLSRWRA